MSTLLHIFIAILAVLVIWFLSGLLISATDRVAKRYHKPGFFVAFFVLGFLTSISEISVLTNATIQGVPAVSAGNLIGASLVIFLLLIPLLAVAGNGVATHAILKKHNLGLLLFVIFIPSAFALDGSLSVYEGWLLLAVYCALVYTVKKRSPAEKIAKDTVRHVKRELIAKRKATMLDCIKVGFAGLLIFFAGKILVDEALFFSTLFRIPPSFIGLILLSIGTNIPEITIALRCVLGRHKNIAFGDYMGSAAANTPLLGILIILNGNFALESSEFIPTSILLFIGLVLFFIFSISKNVLTRKEGAVMLILYVFFILIQLVNIFSLVPTSHGATL